MTKGVDLMKNEEVKELVKGIMDKEESVKNINGVGKYLKEQGVLVNVKVKGINKSISLSPKMLGVNLSEMSEDSRDFYNEHVKTGRIKLLNTNKNQYGSTLRNIGNNVRRVAKEKTIGLNNSLMPMTAYKEYKSYFIEKQEEFMAIREVIYSNWEFIIKNFEVRLDAMFSDLNPMEATNFKNSIMKKIPSKDEFKNNMTLDLEVECLSFAQNTNDISDKEIREDIERNQEAKIINSLYHLTGEILNEAFEICNKAYKTVSKSTFIAPKTNFMLKKAESTLKAKNILENPKINKIGEMISNLITKDNVYDIDVVLGNLENISAIIYGYAHDLNIHKEIEIKKSYPLSNTKVHLILYKDLKNKIYEDDGQTKIAM